MRVQQRHFPGNMITSSTVSSSDIFFLFFSLSLLLSLSLSFSLFLSLSLSISPISSSQNMSRLCRKGAITGSLYQFFNGSNHTEAPEQRLTCVLKRPLFQPGFFFFFFFLFFSFFSLKSIINIWTFFKLSFCRGLNRLSSWARPKSTNEAFKVLNQTESTSRKVDRHFWI